MKLTNLPISQIEGNIILGSMNDKKSLIYEILPFDFKQMSGSDGASYLVNIHNFILSITNNSKNADLRGSIISKFRENKKKESFKFYKLNDQYFVDSPKDIDFLEAMPAQNYFNFFLSGLDDFYSDIVFGEDYFKINTQYFRLVNCYDLPDLISPFALSELGDQVVSISRISQVDATSKLKNNRKLHIGNMSNNIRDIESEKTYSESEFLLEEIISGAEGLFEVEMWFIVKAESEVELNLKTSRLISALKSLDVIPLIETKLSFGEIIPTIFFGVAPIFKRSHFLTATYISSLIPLDREYIFDEGLELFSRSGNPLYFDNFESSSENFNVAITGSTGVGKSVFAQKLVDYSRLQDRSVVIIDIGESFLKYLEYHGGNIFSKQFNPMEFKNPTFLKEFILSFIPEKEISTKEKGKLYCEIQSALSEGIETFSEVIKFLDTKLPDISYYFAEIWPYITNSTTAKNKITYVDLSIYPESIIPGVILFTIEYFKNLGTEEDYRILLIDECWKLLTRNHEYIAECFRTFRKHGCAAISITQNIEDLISLGQISSAILGNCNFKIVFRQPLSDRCKAFFTDHEVDLISTLNSEKGNFSEFLIIAKDGTKRKIARYYATPLEYAIFNTTKSDKLKWQKFKDNYEDLFSVKEIMNAFVILNGDVS
jgi:hypothetical protein